MATLMLLGLQGLSLSTIMLLDNDTDDEGGDPDTDAPEDPSTPADVLQGTDQYDLLVGAAG